jgi:FkbM family methyltransferase
VREPPAFTARRLASYAAGLGVMAAGFRTRSLAAMLAGAAARRPFVLETRDGLRLRVRTLLDAWVVKETCLDGAYDAVAPARADAVVVDVGAGFGDFAIRAARRWPGARVVAAEPYPGSYRLLLENVAMNSVSNVEALPYAITGAEAATTRLAVGAREAVLFSTGADAGGASIEVPARTLENLFEELAIERCDVLKLDCEGAEYDILLDAPSAVLARVEAIVLEYHVGVAPHGPEDLARRLEADGFSVEVRPSRVRASLGLLAAWRRGA